LYQSYLLVDDSEEEVIWTQGRFISKSVTVCSFKVKLLELENVMIDS